MDKNQTGEEFRQLTAFARVDGALMGLMWIVSFACFVGEFSEPMLGVASMAIGVASIIVGTVRLGKFRDNVLGGVITFGKAVLYSMLTYFYAATLMAVAQYVYFQFIDNGYLMNQYVSALSMPEYVSMLKDMYGMEAKELITVLQTTMADMRPIEVAFQFLTLNLILGIFVSLPVGLVTKRTH